MYRFLTGVALAMVALSAQAVTDCSITIVPTTFGAYDDVLPDLDSTSGGITVSCTVQSPSAPGSVSYDLKMSTGNAPTYAPRHMRSGAYTMLYNLYMSGSRSPATIWGDGTSGTQTVGGVITGLDSVGVTRTADHVVYGRIPTGQKSLAVGSYSDAIQVTLSF